ncbi:hypothetical protein BDV59DRAFT_26554 [Aspergillus ambiguus]|uniref:uncharacterized protein n=1 Tax=Aspergillus ambiguus TaxID=176160 RepID=UPI003CCCF3B9
MYGPEFASWCALATLHVPQRFARYPRSVWVFLFLFGWVGFGSCSGILERWKRYTTSALLGFVACSGCSFSCLFLLLFLTYTSHVSLFKKLLSSFSFMYMGCDGLISYELTMKSMGWMRSLWRVSRARRGLDRFAGNCCVVGRLHWILDSYASALIRSDI